MEISSVCSSVSGPPAGSEGYFDEPPGWDSAEPPDHVTSGPPISSYEDYANGDDPYAIWVNGEIEYPSVLDTANFGWPKDFCPFIPDAPGVTPSPQWKTTFSETGASGSLRATETPLPVTRVGVWTEGEYENDSGFLPPAGQGLNWHLPPDKRHPHDLTPTEAGWDARWGVFVPYDSEPVLPVAPPPLPQAGVRAITEWMAGPMKAENLMLGDFDRELARTMAMGHRPDIYERYGIGRDLSMPIRNAPGNEPPARGAGVDLTRQNQDHTDTGERRGQRGPQR